MDKHSSLLCKSKDTDVNSIISLSPGRVRAYPERDLFKGASLRLALAFLANIRLGWKGLSGRNILAKMTR
jgi:hypothetical protein